MESVNYLKENQNHELINLEVKICQALQKYNQAYLSFWQVYFELSTNQANLSDIYLALAYYKFFELLVIQTSELQLEVSKLCSEYVNINKNKSTEIYQRFIGFYVNTSTNIIKVKECILNLTGKSFAEQVNTSTNSDLHEDIEEIDLRENPNIEKHTLVIVNFVKQLLLSNASNNQIVSKVYQDKIDNLYQINLPNSNFVELKLYLPIFKQIILFFFKLTKDFNNKLALEPGCEFNIYNVNEDLTTSLLFQITDTKAIKDKNINIGSLKSYFDHLVVAIGTIKLTIA
jgi:hypothetical protein